MLMLHTIYKTIFNNNISGGGLRNRISESQLCAGQSGRLRGNSVLQRLQGHHVPEVGRYEEMESSDRDLQTDRVAVHLHGIEQLYMSSSTAEAGAL
jgi:hypothetical protein